MGSNTLFLLALLPMQDPVPDGGGPAWHIVAPDGGGELRYILPLAGDEDYPVAAKRADARGTSYVRITIDTAGAITECTVVRSAGRADLDEAACAIYRSRARFVVSGRTAPVVVTAPVDWRLDD